MADRLLPGLPPPQAGGKDRGKCLGKYYLDTSVACRNKNIKSYIF